MTFDDAAHRMLNKIYEHDAAGRMSYAIAELDENYIYLHTLA